MSAPRTKRQYAGAGSDPAQRQITSFFQRTSSSNNSNSSPSEPITVLPPPPPAQVQANLISVGMRVRKSVPEGYKTGHLYGGFSLWAETTNTSSKTTSGPTLGGGRMFGGGGKELAPFCGINKVGGLSAQSATIPELDDVPGLTSSQESITSDFDQPHVIPEPNRRKRVYSVDESENDAPLSFDQIWRERRDFMDGEVSPRSLAPAGWDNARVMAVPKGRRVKVAGQQGPDQENMLLDVGNGGGGVDDFEEAEFLEMEVEFE